MYQFVAVTRVGCHQSCSLHLLLSKTALVVAAASSLIAQFCYSQPVHAESSRPPNVVVILTDDQGWGDLSLHGNPNLSTPNIDSLARDGAEVENFYVCAVCSPTRAEFLTGRYHTRMGVYSTSTGGERFNADEQTIADVFRRERLFDRGVRQVAQRDAVSVPSQCTRL